MSAPPFVPRPHPILKAGPAILRSRGTNGDEEPKKREFQLSEEKFSAKRRINDALAAAADLIVSELTPSVADTGRQIASIFALIEVSDGVNLAVDTVSKID
jgi:hypothetical protein